MGNLLCVAAAILTYEDKILIAKRSAGRHLEYFWEFPGGKIEEGEDAQTCLKREMLEEFGITVSVGKHVLTNIHHYPSFSISLAAYYAKHVTGEFTLHDHAEIEWVTRSELLNFNLAPADIPLAHKVCSK